MTPSILKSIINLLPSKNSECYLVGGWVRDFLLGRPTNDIDIAIDKNPEKLARKLARELKSAFLPLKEDREIFRLITKDGIRIDLAKFKAKTIEADLALRDFSINAMAIKIDSRFKIPFGPSSGRGQDSGRNLLDPFKGKQDLEKKIIRQISPEIYSDDPLRLMRAFRIAAQLNFEIEPGTIKSILENADKIVLSSPERIREELLLILDCPHAHPIIKKLDEMGLFSTIFPEMDPNRKCALEYYPGKGVWGHSLDGLECLERIFKNLKTEFPKHHEKISTFIFRKDTGTEGHSWISIMKLGILFHDIGKASTARVIDGRLRFFEHPEVGAKISRTIAKRLRFSSDAVSNISELVLSHMRSGGLAHGGLITERAKYRFFRDLGSAAIPMLLVSLADRYTYLTDQEQGKNMDIHEKAIKELVLWHYKKNADEARLKKRLVNGNILMNKLKLEPSPLIGKILKSVEEAQALNEIHTTEEAIMFAKSLLKHKELEVSKTGGGL